MGASVNNAFNWLKAPSASADHRKRTGPPFSSEVIDAATWPKLRLIASQGIPNTKVKILNRK
jgi:hypothetical protein